MSNNERLIKDENKSNTKTLEWSVISIHTFVKIAIIGILFVWFYFNQVYYSMIHKWINDPSWSHGFLIPLFSLYFLNQNKTEILQIKQKTNWLGMVLMVMTFGLYALNVVQLKIGTLYSLLMIPTLLGIVLFLCGWKMIKSTWLPIVFIGFAIPIPDRMYKTITIPMRIIAAKIAAGMLSFVHELEATSQGVIINITYKGEAMEPALDVAEACSGMRLLMAFVALGVAMAWLHKRPFLHRIILLISTVPIAIFCNIVRVTVTGFIYVLLEPKYAQGIYHDLLGMLMLPLAFILYGALAKFMSSLFIEEEHLEKPKEDIIVRKQEAE